MSKNSLLILFSFLALNLKAHAFDVKVKMINFNPDHEKKVLKAIELIKRVVNSPDFKAGVLSKNFEGKECFAENGEMTNHEVYEKILEGAEILGDSSKNNIMDLELRVYRDDSSHTIGYTYPSIKPIYMNMKYLDKFEPHQVADNLFHEWLHKLGFTHTIKNTPQRVHTVPYSIGYLVRDLAKRMEINPNVMETRQAQDSP